MMGEEATMCLKTHTPDNVVVKKWYRIITSEGGPTLAYFSPSSGPSSTAPFKYGLSEKGDCLRIFNVSEKDVGVYVRTTVFTSRRENEISMSELKVYAVPTTSKQEAITQASIVSTAVSTNAREIPDDGDEPPKIGLLELILAVGLPVICICGVIAGVLYCKCRNKTVHGERGGSSASAAFQPLEMTRTSQNEHDISNENAIMV
ncbi:uncharacterized protein [Diadema antillarum]|uniref:uncharacterized protein n=1 Tax=Diadema antillarum TaxID=105358 RepID=UPI003A888F47